MDYINEATLLPDNITCKVCGEKDFSERDGFYYCNECLTKHDQIQQVVLEFEEDFRHNVKYMKKTKIKQTKSEKPQLTSWECYNYILRGLVEQLLNIGAKEEIKLMTLQIWAAYLRATEVAFFNKQHSDLPRLNARFHKVDAEAIYNHQVKAKPKARKKKTGSSIHSGTDERCNPKDLRKSLRKLNESLYSGLSSSEYSQSLTSGATNSVRALRIRYNKKSRKLLKKVMSVKHLDKHESDINEVLTCHKRPRSSDVSRWEFGVHVINLKIIYGILGIALNLIEDDIQLCDLVRFINMGHINKKNVLQYFPSDWSNNNGVEILKKIGFYHLARKYPDKALREHMANFCNYIGIKKFKMPNMIKLVQRYVAELCLPPEIATYAERIINLHPPRFTYRRLNFYPQYEARAMAYIIFVLKLLYGLDGYKEQIISDNAVKINQKIKDFNMKSKDTVKPLFVWNDWVYYIEMRKVILGHFSIDLCKQYKQKPTMEQYLQEITPQDNNEVDEDHDNTCNELKKPSTRQRFNDIKSIFTKMWDATVNTNKNNSYNVNSNNNLNSHQLTSLMKLEFMPTLSPATTYLKNTLSYVKSHEKFLSNNLLQIPDFMENDYTKHNVMPYIELQPFVKYFKANHCKLNIKEISITEGNNKFVGIFRAPVIISRGLEACMLRAQRANFNITNSEWSSRVRREVSQNMDNLEFKDKLNQYTTNYFRKKLQLKKMNVLDTQNNIEQIALNMHSEYLQSAPHVNSEIKPCTNYLTSIEAFSENNMDPLPFYNLQIQRNLDNVNILENLSDDNCDDNCDDNNDKSAKQTPNDINSNSKEKENIDFCISKMDYWLLIGYMNHLTIPRKKQLQEKFPLSFNWLLETCAQTLNVDWTSIYEQLIIIETMFGMGLENFNDFSSCLYFKYFNPIKDYNTLINNYRCSW